MNILLTGGTGYIGSHTAVVLAAAGHRVILYDNLSNSRADVVATLQEITGQSMPFVQADVRDPEKVAATLRNYKVDAIIHFAGCKAVGESVAKPLAYYENNICGATGLLRAMTACNIKTLIFSSSATVYGNPRYLPVDEQHPLGATNPYGRTKLHIEEMLADLAKADPAWRIVSLRYFNPVGAHESGRLGEDPDGLPNNLLPSIARVAAGTLPQLDIFGDDYDTRDGTGVRDFIHVMDLAEGHLSALAHLFEGSDPLRIYNLGTGQGYSVLEMVQAFEAASGRSVPYTFAPRREGDVASCYASADKAAVELNWRAGRTLEEMCASAWKFQTLGAK
jgi:UDP-glucose 4-epimerase